MAPATQARTTSLIVPPRRFLTDLTASRSNRVQSKRRCGPISGLSGVLVAGARPAENASPIPPRPLRTADIDCRGSASRCWAPRSSDTGSEARRHSSSASNCDPDGTGRGTVEAVQENPASDLLVLDTGALVPLRFVTGRDDEGRVVVDVPAGLFELLEE